MIVSEQPPQPDRSEPSEERKAELRDAYQEGSDAPYRGVQIRTLGELEWNFSESGWSGKNSLQAGELRPNLNGAILKGTNLSGAELREAWMIGTDFSDATLSGAIMSKASLSNAKLSRATVNGAFLIQALLDKADCVGANFSGANLTGATMSGANFNFSILREANLFHADLSGLFATRAMLSGADLSGATLKGASLIETNMSEGNLSEANLDKACFVRAILNGANLSESSVSGTDFTRALLDVETNLDGATWTDPPIFLGVRWNSAPLDGIKWEQHHRLGDEQAITKAATRADRVSAYRNAARAYHGLVIALESQGLTVPARRLRQREHFLQRRALRARPRTWGSYLFYALLNLISGQGEAPERIFAAYAVIISFFTGVYWAVSHQFQTSSHPLHWYEALVLSLSSFHGRGFFPSQIGLGDPLAIIASIEAVIGLFIELILIATFSNRFLNT